MRRRTDWQTVLGLLTAAALLTACGHFRSPVLTPEPWVEPEGFAAGDQWSGEPD